MGSIKKEDSFSSGNKYFGEQGNEEEDNVISAKSTARKRTIFSCCEEADVLGLKEIFKDGESPSEVNEAGLCPLHVLVQSCGIDAEACIDLLLERGADVNQTTTIEGDSSLHLVTRNKSKERAMDIFLKLLGSGADPEIRNKKLRSPYDEGVEQGLVDICSVLDGTLSVEDARTESDQRRNDELGNRLVNAVISGTEIEIQRAMAHGGPYLNYINKHGAGPIHYVITHCKLDQMKILELLVETGAEVNLLDYECDSALNLSIKMANLRDGGVMRELVAYLLSVGADQSFQDLDGKDAMVLAQERQYDDIVQLLSTGTVERLPPVTEVEEPAESPQEPEGPKDDGLDPLHHAVISEEFADDRPGRIEWLVNNGSPVNVKTKNEEDTALHLAALNNLSDVVEKLLELGADSSLKNKEEKMPYDIAMEFEFEKVAEILERDMRSKNIQAKWRKAAKKAKSCVLL